jgi:hypothetical protein
MSARLFVFILLTSPALIFAAQVDNKDQELEIFEFLALFDQKDSIYLDTEMDDAKISAQPSEATSTVTKSKSNEK